MKWLNNLINGRSANTAKNRLQIVIAQQREARDQLDFLPLLHKEILLVIQKYIKINAEMVEVDWKHQDTSTILKLNIALPNKDKELIGE